MTLRKEKEKVLAQVELGFSTGFAFCRDPAFICIPHGTELCLGKYTKVWQSRSFVEEKTEVMSAEVRDATLACLVAIKIHRV